MTDQETTTNVVAQLSPQAVVDLALAKAELLKIQAEYSRSLASAALRSAPTVLPSWFVPVSLQSSRPST